MSDTLEAAEQLLAHRRVRRAARLLKQAERSGADADRCAGGLWLAHMLCGAYAQAWRESDAIRARGNPDPHRVWTGEPVDGKRVLLRSLHGFGDAVQFLRFAPALRALASRLTLQVAPELFELVRSLPGPDAVTVWGAEESAHDVEVEVTEMPYLLRTTVDTLPPPSMFCLPADLVHQADAVIRAWPRPAVGMVWSPGAWNPSRGVPWEQMQQLARVVRGSAWNLQGGPERERANRLLLDAPELCNAGLLPMAAMLRTLDLVITPDTLAAHLAASLGTPTWLLLQKEADWRWMIRRSDSPWYPAMRLFRNRRQHGWEPTMARVCAALRRFTHEFHRNEQPA